MQNSINGFNHSEKKYVKIEKLKDEIHRFRYDLEKRRYPQEEIKIEEQNGIF